MYLQRRLKTTGGETHTRFTATGQKIEVKSGRSVANTEQLKGKRGVRDATEQSLLVTTTNPTVQHLSQFKARTMDENNPNYKLLAEKIEKRYRNDLVGKFPYKDCYSLQKKYPKQMTSIVPDLDEYFSFIAGYSSSATRLNERSKDELRRAVPELRRSFLDKNPQYALLKDDEEALSRQINIADELRLDLIIIMEWFSDF
jgi:hypothetical protein